MSRLPSGETGPKEASGENAEAEAQTGDDKKIADLLEWMRKDLGISDKFEENEKDGLFFVSRILELHKMNVQKAKRFIMKYHKSRCDGGVEYFQNRNSESDEILKSCQSAYLFTLPLLTKGGQKIVYCKIAPGMKAEDFDQKAFFKRFFMVSDIRFKEEPISNGDLYILDMEGFTRQHAMKFLNSGHMGKFVKSLKDTYPRRLHAIHLIRTKPWHKNAVGLWLKVSGASKKILERIKCHSLHDEGLEGLGVQMEQLSGRLQDLNDAWTQRLICNSSWFESCDARYKTIAIKNLKVDKQRDKSENGKLQISQQSEVYTFRSLEGVFRQIEIEDH